MEEWGDDQFKWIVKKMPRKIADVRREVHDHPRIGTLSYSSKFSLSVNGSTYCVKEDNASLRNFWKSLYHNIPHEHVSYKVEGCFNQNEIDEGEYHFYRQ